MSSDQAPVTITYHQPGTQPPVQVAGTFTDPPWQPVEMDYTRRSDGEYDFKKEVHGPPGTKIQYKFCIADNWLLKDGDPTMTDDNGILNHFVEVPEIPEKDEKHEKEEKEEQVD
jgi:hypothetical protein